MVFTGGYAAFRWILPYETRDESLRIMRGFIFAFTGGYNIQPMPIYQKDESMVFRKIGDETFLVPLRNNVGELDNMYVLDEVGARIWELLDGSNTTEEIGGILCAEYDAEAEAIRKDLEEFLEALESVGAVRRNDRGRPQNP